MEKVEPKKSYKFRNTDFEEKDNNPTDIELSDHINVKLSTKKVKFLLSKLQQ